ncbi:MAG TPA: nodulation protein NfeD [Synergistaceae bacterium]|nr:nodulation protein NfeD [Synergistaceae bacterium]
MKRRNPSFRIFFLSLCLFYFLVPLSAEALTRVVVTPLRGSVGLPMERHLQEVMEEVASSKEPSLLVLELDTPGGLVSSMRSITKSILGASFPVVVWVSPQGAQAASAGAFILQSAAVAAMAPGTNAGAAHPVTAGGKDVPSETMNEKVTNDLSAYMRSLAQERGRNAVTAERMVRYSLSLSASEALQEGVADLLAEDLESLLTALEGRQIPLPGEEITLDLGEYRVEQRPMSLRLQLLEMVTRPDVAYLLLIAGLYAVVFEILSPGGFVLAVSGGILLLLGALGLRMLPFNWGGVVLLVAGVLVMVLDLLVGGVGVLSIIGTVALVVGGLVLFRAPGGELLDFSLSFMIGGVVVLTGFFLIAAWGVWRSLKKPVTSGYEGLQGEKGKVIKPLDPEGMVLYHGEYWKAVSLSGDTLPLGTPVRLVRTEGLLLVVTPEEEKKENFQESS